MSVLLSVISLTGVHSSLVVASPCSVGSEVVGIGQGSVGIISNITQLFPTTTVRIPGSHCFLLLVKSTTRTAGIDTQRRLKHCPDQLRLFYAFSCWLKTYFLWPPPKKKQKKIWNRVDCQRSEKRSKTHKRLKERFLIRRNRTKQKTVKGITVFCCIVRSLKKMITLKICTFCPVPSY